MYGHTIKYFYDSLFSIKSKIFFSISFFTTIHRFQNEATEKEIRTISHASDAINQYHWIPSILSHEIIFRKFFWRLYYRSVDVYVIWLEPLFIDILLVCEFLSFSFSVIYVKSSSNTWNLFKAMFEWNSTFMVALVHACWCHLSHNFGIGQMLWIIHW